jgi:DNA-binding LacI/PurR family transcriptional regulator
MPTTADRATLRDIAARAHVSASTVSRVLNNYRFVDEVTRNAVLDAARELDYPIDALRKAPTATKTVLMLSRNAFEAPGAHSLLLGGTLEHQLTHGAQSVLADAGLNLRTERDAGYPTNAAQYAAEAGMQGLLLIGGIQDPGFLEGLRAAEVPFVVVAAPVRGVSVNYVSPNYGRGIEDAVAHLAGAGRRRIALVNGPATTETSAEKLRGYRAAVALRELPFDASQLVFADAFDPDSGFEATSRLLEQTPEVDAIVYALDDLAFGGLRCLRTAGRRVPQDVAVVGFMDYEIARFCEPPLTTVRADLAHIGAIAARRLVNMIERPDGDELHIYVPTELVIRDSA